MQLLRMSCCGSSWVGVERAHCCRRTGGCGQVFDDAELWDAHRTRGTCVDPRALGWVSTKNGIWLRGLDLVPAGTHRRRSAGTGSAPRQRRQRQPG